MKRPYTNHKIEYQLCNIKRLSIPLIFVFDRSELFEEYE